MIYYIQEQTFLAKIVRQEIQFVNSNLKSLKSFFFNLPASITSTMTNAIILLAAPDMMSEYHLF